jgi:hypothetical protein
MRKFLYNALIIKPDLYRDEMADLLYKEFRGKVSERSISQALHAINWSRKRLHCIAQQQDPDL